MPTIGCFCSYAPLALLEAAGYSTCRLAGDETCECANDVGCMPSRLCGHARRCFRVARSGDRRIEGMLLTNSCTAMERLYDYLRHDLSLGFVYMLDVPRKTTPEAIALFGRRLGQLLEALEDRWGLQVDQETLASRIGRWAEGGGENTALGTRRGGSPQREGGPRILLTGSASATASTIQLIEKMGAAVVLEDSCTTRVASVRGIMSRDRDSVLRELAARYLTKMPCPRMVDGGRRSAEISAMVRAGRIDGIVYLARKGCIGHYYSHAGLKRRATVPLLFLEAEGEDAGSHQMLERIQAFVDLLSSGKEVPGASGSGPRESEGG